jgi:hypothetical protein
MQADPLLQDTRYKNPETPPRSSSEMTDDGDRVLVTPKIQFIIARSATNQTTGDHDYSTKYSTALKTRLKSKKGRNNDKSSQARTSERILEKYRRLRGFKTDAYDLRFDYSRGN